MEFSDGMKFDTSSKIHVERRHDGYYVVGKGMLIPVETYEEGMEIINEMKGGEENNADC